MRFDWKWKICIPIIACMAAIPWSVRAQEADALAREKFTEGRTLFDEGRYAEAAQAFTDAWRRDPNWKLLYNIAQSEAAARNYGAALIRFEEYLSSGGDEIPAERRDEVLAEIRRLRDIVAYVEIAAPAGCTVLVNNSEWGITPLSGPVVITAGTEHQIVLQREGRELFRHNVRISSQTTRKLAFDEPPAEQTDEPSADAAPPGEVEKAAPTEPDSRLMTAGWTTLSIGAAALAAMAVTGSLALSKGRALDDKYDGRVPAPQADRVDTVNHLSLATDILLICGSALAATGIVLLIAGHRKKRAESLSLTPSLGRGHFTLSVFREF
jgi:tetratricopeptide (TPR) repeat protein